MIIPTLNDLFNSILADIEATYGTPVSTFGKSFLRTMAMVQAAKLKIYYYAIAKVQKNVWVDFADTEANGGTLERFGRVKLNRDPFPAQAGQYEVIVNGNIGSTITASTTFKSNDDSANPGKLFILDAEYILIAEIDNITLRALESGIDSKLEIGNKLTGTQPIAGVNKLVEVNSEVIQPQAAEDIELYRQRAIDAYRLEPQGGAASDFRLWAADAQGVQQSYPYAKTGESGEVNLFVEATIADSIDGKGTPSQQLLDDVEEVVELDPDNTRPIEERGRRPLGVFLVNYLPVIIKGIDIIIEDFVGLTPEIETQLFNAIELTINDIRPFVAGADVLENKNDILNTNIIISTILEARPGSIFGNVTLKVDGNIETTFTFLNGDIPHLDSVTYI